MGGLSSSHQVWLPDAGCRGDRVPIIYTCVYRMMVLALVPDSSNSVRNPTCPSTFGLIVFGYVARANCDDGILLPMPRYFTLQEANETLDKIRPLMDEIQVIRQEILARKPEFWPVVERSAGNGGSAAASKLVEGFERLDILVHQIQEAGALFKDINLGLLDFPALRDGREVYLCWKYGEDDIDYWHELDAGYAGRRSIDSF